MEVQRSIVLSSFKLQDHRFQSDARRIIQQVVGAIPYKAAFIIVRESVYDRHDEQLGLPNVLNRKIVTSPTRLHIIQTHASIS